MVNPYSAEHPVPPEKFAGRIHQIEEFDRFLTDTIEGNSKNLAILGGWGIGKTSLLRIFKHRAEHRNCAATIIELGESTDSFIALFETITRSIAKDATQMSGTAAKIREFLEGLSLSVNYGPVGISYSDKKKMNPDMFRFKEDLISISGTLDVPYLIMLDNAEQLLAIKGAIFELRNIFQTIQSADGVRCMLILSGKETLFSDMRSASEPAVRFFWGIDLGPFSREETREAIAKPLAGTGIAFDEACIDRIFDLTRGHPYFVQVFAYNLFSAGTGSRITLADLEQNYPRILTYLGKRLFESVYSRTSQNERKILYAFVQSDKDLLSKYGDRGIERCEKREYLLKEPEWFPYTIALQGGTGKIFVVSPAFCGISEEYPVLTEEPDILSGKTIGDGIGGVTPFALEVLKANS